VEVCVGAECEVRRGVRGGRRGRREVVRES
jgi:hypothetical protein